MQDLIKKEKKFFSTLQNNNSINDYIRISHAHIPKPYSNKLNRFYSEDDSFWFARLKIKDTKTIYYFGLNRNDINLIEPDLILKFNAESLSPIRFIENKVFILAKLKNNNKDYLKSLSSNFNISKNKKNKDFYYFLLGDVESNEIISNIKLFIELFDYDFDFKKNYLIINDPIVENFNNLNHKLFTLKNNVEIYRIIDFLKNTSLNQKIIDSIISYLFVEDKNHNYSLNKDLFNYNLPISRYFNFIFEYLKNYEKYLELDVDDAIRLFKENFNEAISNFENILSNQIIVHGEEVTEDNELLNEYIHLLESPKVKYHLVPSYGISEDDFSQICTNIEIDIDEGIITNDDNPDSIIENYFKDYLSEINSNEILKYFDGYINGISFNELLNNYNELDQDDVEDIKNKIKFDIGNENLNEGDIDKRFEIYFSKKALEIKYIRELDAEFQNHRKYIKLGLRDTEIDEIFENIYEKIINWHNDWTIFDENLQKSIDTFVDKKLRNLRSNTNQRFEEMFPNKKSIKDVLNKPILSEKEYEQLTDKIYKDMFDLTIRSNEICDELIIEYYNKYVK